MNVRLCCGFAQSAIVRRLCILSFQTNTGWGQMERCLTGWCHSFCLLLSTCSYSGLCVIRAHRPTHTGAQAAPEIDAETLHEGQTASTSYQAGLKCHILHATKQKKCDKFAYVMQTKHFSLEHDLDFQ